jgi:TolA-binding protein
MLIDGRKSWGVRAAIALLAVLCLSHSSCAYYNTFFFAKKYYKQAARAREERTDDQASAAEIQYYEKCIRQCSKVMAEYPDSKYVDDALFLTATSYYWWGRQLEAMKWYRQLIERYPESERIPEARLMLARCHLDLREFVEAESILIEILNSSAKMDKDRVLFALAEVYAGRGDEDSAVRVLRRLLKEHPKSDLRLESMMAMGDAYFAKGVYDSAATSYEDVAKGSGEQDERVEARKRMGEALFAAGDPQGALDIYVALLRTVETPVGSRRVKDPQEAALVLRIGECQNALGNHERALEMFQRVMTDFQNTTWAAEAEFLTGYTYEIFYEDLERAKTSYDRVPSHSQLSVFVDEAKRRGEGLGKLREYIEKRDDGGVEAAEEAAAQGLFLSAELNLFELNKPQVALDLYRQVENQYPDSPYAPKAAYAAAWVLVNRLNREEEGYDEYRRVLIKYPYSDYADGARRVLGMAPLAALYQGPPIPEGWTHPDSSGQGRGLQAPGAADTTAGAVAAAVGDTAGVPGIGALSDTTGAASLTPETPDSTATDRELAMGPDSTGAPADTSGPPGPSGSEPPRWRGEDAPGDSATDSGAGAAPSEGGSPADTTDGETGGPPSGGAAPPDTTAGDSTSPPSGQEGAPVDSTAGGAGGPPSEEGVVPPDTTAGGAVGPPTEEGTAPQDTTSSRAGTPSTEGGTAPSDTTAGENPSPPSGGESQPGAANEAGTETGGVPAGGVTDPNNVPQAGTSSATEEDP